MSVWNIYRWYASRKDHQQSPLNDLERKIIASELDILHEALPYICSDPRLGVHQEAKAKMVTQPKIEGKIKTLKTMLRENR